MKKTTRELCALCKGSRKLCGASICPILVKRILSPKIRVLSKRELSGYSEWLLVGEYGYPQVRFGPLSAISSLPWDPERWAKERFDFSRILTLRMKSLYPFQRRIVHKPPSFEDPLGESVLSIKPIEIELILRKEPRIQLRFDADIPPFGGSAPLQKLELEDNPKIPRRVENLIVDRVKASYAVRYLRKYGMSIYYIQKIFSAGFLGIAERRRIVPTRWGITAVDSIIGNSIIPQIKHAPSFSQTRVYHWEYLGNKYYIILIPNDYWAMEMFEVWLPNSVWVRGVGRPVVIRNYESYDGKPVKMDGGYYAIRTSVLEWLKERNRVASILAIRIITPQYIAPVGNWQIRESIRLALDSNPIFVGDLDECLQHVISREPVLRSVGIKESSWLLCQLAHRPLDYWLK